MMVMVCLLLSELPGQVSESCKETGIIAFNFWMCVPSFHCFGAGHCCHAMCAVKQVFPSVVTCSTVFLLEHWIIHSDDIVRNIDVAIFHKSLKNVLSH